MQAALFSAFGRESCRAFSRIRNGSLTREPFDFAVDPKKFKDTGNLSAIFLT